MANVQLTANTSSLSVNQTNNTITVSQTPANITIAEIKNPSAVETVVPLGNKSGNVTLDLDSGTIQSLTADGDITGLTLNNIVAGQTCTIIITQDSIGGRELDLTTHASNWTLWDFVNDFTDLDQTANNWSIINLFFDGSKYYASLVLDQVSTTGIPNSDLANSNITLNGTTIDLGSSGNIANFGPLTTDNLPEGSSALYYSNARSRSAVSVSQSSASGNGTLSYSSGTGVFTYTPPDLSTVGRGALSVTNVLAPSGPGDLAYNSSTGVFTYTPVDLSNYLTSVYSDLSPDLGGNLNLFGFRITDTDSGAPNEGIYLTTPIQTANTVSFGNSVTQTHNFTGNLNVTGNIEVSGNLNYRNVEDLYVRDQSITLNANATTDATSSIIINRPQAGANTVLRWNETDDKWQFSNDGSSYQNLIGLTNLSVTTASASGSGSLAYANTTGVFTFTPPDLSGAGLTNAQAQTFIQSNGLAMTANISAGSLTIDATDSGTINYVREPSNGSTAMDVIVSSEAYSGDTFTSQMDFKKAGGSLASPSRIGNNDTSGHLAFWGHDGTQFSSNPNAGYWVFYDRDTDTGIGANNVPLAHEFYVNPTAGAGDFQSSVLKLTPDRRVVFQNTGTRGFGNNRGLASIEADGNIHTQQGLSANNSIITTAGTISGPTLTDGTMSINSGSITSAVNGTFSGTVNAGTFTDGTFSVTGGNFTTVGSIGATGNIDTNGNITSFSAGGFIGNFNGDGSNITGVAAATSTTSEQTDAVVKVCIATETINKGQAVAITGGTGDNPNVSLALASNASLMPAFGIALENITATNTGNIAIYGVISGVDTSTFTVGDELFISTSSAGDFQVTAPTGETNQIQKVGKVVRSNASGIISVQGAGRTNATPNLDDGKIFLGNASNQAVTAVFTDEANTAIAANLAAFTSNIITTGNVQINPDTAVAGLKGFTFDASTNRLGLGTTSPTAGLEIVSDGDIDSQIFLTEYSTSSSSPDIRMRRAEGSLSAPRFVNSGDHIGQWYHYGWRENADPTGNASFSDAYGGSFATTGGVEISSFADGDYLVHHLPVGNITSQGGGLADYIKLTDQTIRFNDGTIFVLDGTTNANLTALNGKAFYVDQGGGSTTRTYELYYDEDRTLPVQVATGTEDFTNGQANVVSVAQPVGLEFIINDGTTPNRFSTRRITKLRANGEMQFGCSDTDKDGTPTATIDVDGVIETTANITGANITGTYLYGDGTNISGIGGSVNSFESIAVSGGNTVVADSSTDTLNLVAAGAITITADAATDTITIGGTGGTYGNTDVENFLSANVVTANISSQGNLIVNKDLIADNDIKAGNAIFTDSIQTFTGGGTFTMNALRVTDFKANDPLGVASVANTALSGGTFTSPFQGSIAYVINDRHGSRGAPCYFDGTSWRYFSDDANVTI